MTPTATACDCDNGWVDLGDAVARCPQCRPPKVDVAYARTSDPETSHQAAASLSDLNKLQAFVYARLSECGPITDEGLIGFIQQRYRYKNMSEESIRTRRHELVKHGLVKDTGSRRMTSSGRKSRVWRVT